MNAARTLKYGWALGLLALAACGSGSGSGGGSAANNTAPQASISSPAAGQTFRAGDTVNFAGSASDAEDGVLAASRLSWWAELHHDSHTHPFQPVTAGGGGKVTIPVRGETAATIFYRFHLLATDSAGATHEVTRDVQPQTAQITLVTVPAGLALTRDGQPVTSPSAVTGVVGMERDLGAADQNFGGRRYRFDTWSDGMAATHTIVTQATDSTYTANFSDIGAATNAAPTVTLSAAATGTTGTAMTLSAAAADSDGSVAKVEFFDAATKLGEDLTSPYTLVWTPTTVGAHSLTARATDNLGLATTSAAVTVTVGLPTSDTTPPTATLTSPANFAAGLTGTINLAANASDNVGVVGVEFQVDGVQVGATDTTAPYAVSLDTSGYPKGQHVVRARARDAAGNLSPFATATVQVGGSLTQPIGFTRNESWLTGLSSATAFAQAPDGRLFIAEQGGALRVVKNGALLPAPFVQLTVDSTGERGLLGVAFHPNFTSNNFVYVYHTVIVAGFSHNRISRLTASGDVATGLPLTLVDLPDLSSATNHNGGAMHFGLDGKLYVGVGENANSANSQSLNNVLGKMLRFNDDGSIPSDNPFFNSALGQAQAIWAYGLRNPFTFAVQPGTGKIFINDVGQNTWEEVNLGAPGANYGWATSEGPDNLLSNFTAPLFTYKHSAASPAGSGAGGFFTGFAIAGGSFYPSTGAFPASYRDQYYFADYVSQFVGRLDLANGNAAYAFASLSNPPVDVMAASDGALYVLTRGGVTKFTAP